MSKKRESKELRHYDVRPYANVIKPQAGPQEKFLSSPADIVIYGGAAGGGKALPLSTGIPTPDGWTNLGDIKQGDQVFDETGTPCNVIQVFDIIDAPMSYRLTFSDGVEQIACKDHQWATMTYQARCQEHRCDPEVYAKHKAAKPSKIGGKKSETFTSAIIARNKSRVYDKKPWPPKPEIYTTEQIATSLYHNKGNGNQVANHGILNTLPLNLPEKEFEIDPYVLGAWLGDGTTSSGHITSMDPEIVERVAKFFPVGYSKQCVNPATGELSKASYYRFEGLLQALRKINVLGNKHIPQDYLRGSIPQRLALLQGLMDTDGGVAKNPNGVPKNCEFSTTLEKLRDGFSELLASLGIKSTWIASRARLYGKDCGANYRFHFSADLSVFHLTRKASLYPGKEIQKRYKYRFIVSCEPCPSVPMCCISVDSPSHLYLAGKHMLPTHNSFGMLLEPLRHVTNNKEFFAVFFRRNTTQIRNPGGLWDESMKLYPFAGGNPVASILEWRWPNGGKVKMAHLENENTILEWQGSQVPLFLFDELTHFSQAQFFYMLSRNRSMCGVKPYIRASCNPDADSWVATFIEWWIDQTTGLPIEERSGVVRWFIRLQDSIFWADSRQDLVDKYGNPELPDDHEDQVRPKSVTFIPAKLSDNKALLKGDPDYKANLMALSRVERERLLYGNWKIKPAAGLYFKRSDVNIVDIIPDDVEKWVRRWDFAATVAGEANPDPDWTASVLMGRRKNGRYIVANVTHDRKKSHDVRELVKRVANNDTRKVRIGISIDPGQAGVEQAQSYVRELAGFVVETIRETGDKITRADPVAAQWQAGNIDILRGVWNEEFFMELEAFGGSKGHDDQVDCLSGAFLMLVGSSLSTWSKLGR
jgi:predicted phage terminase large subunit-like protein